VIFVTRLRTAIKRGPLPLKIGARGTVPAQRISAAASFELSRLGFILIVSF
jgi:hypothetical protein